VKNLREKIDDEVTLLVDGIYHEAYERQYYTNVVIKPRDEILGPVRMQVCFYIREPIRQEL